MMFFMVTSKNITGMRFGRILVLYKTKARNKSSAFYYCVCDCGIEKVISGALLRNKLQVSCGCYRAANKPNMKHGLANKSPAYKAWKEMKQRCYNTNSSKYKNWGGRGIIVCDRWINSFENFFADMGERPLNKTSIDRIDVNGNYEKSNCRWATPKEQAETNRGCFRKGNIPYNKPS